MEPINIVSAVKQIHKEEQRKRQENPLAAYSTRQLQAELQRRKKQKIHF